MFGFFLCAFVASISLINAHRHSYYLPGVAPKTYTEGEPVSFHYLIKNFSFLLWPLN
jgi:hypothetical protein